jgi:probable selenium-dependent hydroxylase accessory protein YqeC
MINLLPVVPGITSVVGSGGKTTLLHELAGALGGTVLLATSTHMLPYDDCPVLLDPSRDELAHALARDRVVQVGSLADEGKLSSPSLPWDDLAKLATYVLVEADGSRGLPLKAHLPFEPVIPEGSGQTILVVGASGFGRPVREVAHRWERFCALSGADPDTPASPEDVAAVIDAESLADRVVVNQCETDERRAQAARLAALVGSPVVCGSVRGLRLESANLPPLADGS